MNFSIASLLANFTDDKSLTLKTIQKKLHCETDDSMRELQIALDALERIGVLSKDKGKYQRATEDGVVEGKLRCSSKGFVLPFKMTKPPTISIFGKVSSIRPGMAIASWCE
jgi:ribonuclease R